jgi:molybdopterin synthase catalytic subunit
MRYEISSDALDLAPLVAAVKHDDSGGVVTFVGYVRATSDDARAVEGLVYEGHRELALAELHAIGAEAFARFGGARVAIAHRLGSLDVGEAAVAIAAAAPHRAEAFDACRYAIDELKKRVAIWKRERYVDGDDAWRENPT